ncbi:sodium channel protein 1 brain-like isoform X2 [Ruditapes philippinarum]|uniref:sodium channel protein 1 brain-like isoform X2 n=1 Tax=Ruditapes philippinarum TaxID=129788 RepID=UPI00295C3915|nr:sodium channel protein 1 brain-like isoform X2 [Ruditapes philippinarum]
MTTVEGSKDDIPTNNPPADEADSDDEDEDENLIFAPFTAESWENQLLHEKMAKEKEEENKKNQGEAHLVDGELHFDSEEHHGPQKTRNPALIEGNTLKEDSGFPKEKYGQPMEEFDKLIRENDKTFCVIAPRFKKEYIYRFSSTPSFYLLNVWNPFRRFCVYIATNQYFDYLIITTILTNCIFLAMPSSDAATISEYVFLAIYTVEMVIKLLARGFIINSFTYLRDAWNWLDFLVICSAYLTIILENTSGGGGLGNLQGIRTFRVFRVLRTISIVPGLKTIVNALLRAFRMLLEVMMLILFCLMVFALFSLQIYMGTLRQKCVLEAPDYTGTPAYSYAQFYNDHIKNSSNWYDDGEGFVLCGNVSGSFKCPTNYTCLKDIGENPNWGYTNFDHFGWAMLTSFQLMTLDFWEDTYNKVLKTSGPWNVIFFIFVVFFGAFYLVNLMLAVVAMSYEQESEAAGKGKPKMKMFKQYADSENGTEEKEKELKNKNKKKKKKKKEEKKDPWKDLADETVKAAKAAVEMAYPHHHAKIPTSSTTRPLGNPNHQTMADKSRPHIKRNPMVKMASKDSGTGNSVESSRSNGSKDGDYLINEDGSFGGSTIDIIKKDGQKIKKPFVKQASSGMVSSSGVTLTHDNKMVGEETERDIDQGMYEDDTEETVNRNGPGRQYVAKTYPNVVIIDVAEDTYENDPEKGQVINRNPECCWNCCGGRLMLHWIKFQQICFKIIAEPLFDLFIILCILLNTAFMAAEHHNQPDALTQLLDVSNYVFSGVFIVEAILKLSALTKFYFKNPWNVFDLVIVIASIVDMSVTGVDGLTVFRSFRLMRVFKLAQSWPTMRLLLSIIMNTLGALGNLTLILCIVIYIFAVIGLQLFNDKYTADKFGDDGVPRWHFKDIFHSFMMIFRVLCGEWIEPLWDCMRAANEICMAVFLPTLVLGYFIVLNLFLALLLNAFASDTLRDAKESEEDTKLKIAFKRLFDLCCCCFKKKNSDVNSVTPDRDDEDLGSVEEIHEKSNGMKPVNGAVKNDVVDNAFTTKRDQYYDFNKTLEASKKKGNEVADEVKENTKDTAAILDEDKKSDKKEKEGVRIYKVPKPRPIPKMVGKDRNKVDTTLNVKPAKDADELELGAEASNIKEEDKDDKENEDKIIEIYDWWPLWISKRLHKKNWCFCCWGYDENSPFWEKWFMFRVYMNMVAEHKVFEAIILFLIAVSSITLAFEDVNLYSRPALVSALYWLNIIFATLFGIEMLIKWCAFGFKRYFTSFWCLLDFLIVVISVASLIAEAYGAANFSAFRSLRTLRALRPLRAISRWQGMRIVVNALMMAIPSIVNVLVVCLVFWLIFSILGVQFFKGEFYFCTEDGENMADPDIIPDKATCLANNLTWKNYDINFDNVLQGFLALFQVATFEGWMEVMSLAVDSVGIDKQPKFENSLYMYLFFVAFIIFGAFFTLNLFIGVIIDNFNMLKKKYDGSYLDMFLTSGQRQYYNTIKKLGNKKPQKTIKRPKNKIQGIFYDISNSSKFELCIVVFIFLNMIQMAVDHYNQTQMVTDVLAMLNILFVVIFTLEAIVKIIGLRWHYFTMPWNVFDFVVVVLSLLGVLLSDVMSGVIVSPTLLRVVRVFRIGRVLRLIKAAKGIRKLLFALVISLPALLNIGMLLFLIMYIYAIIFLSTFQNLKITGVLDDDVVNFKTFLNSFLLLFRLSTAAGWNDVLLPMLVQPPNCNDTHYTRDDGVIMEQSPGDCGTPWMAVIGLTSYILIIFLVVINMFIAVILENFNQAHEQEEAGITEDDFDMFYVIWEKYDPLATQFIKYEQMSNFVADLDPPLSIPKPNEIAIVSFDLPIAEGDKLHCLDVLMGLVKYVLGNVEETPEFQQLHEQMERRFQTAFPTRVTTIRKTTTMMRKKEDVAAKTLQRAWRSWKAQKQMKSIAALAMQHHSRISVANLSDTRQKSSSIRNLGTRLTTALSAFFGSTRSSSAVSSVESETLPAGESHNPRRKQASSAIELPQVSSSYRSERKRDVVL